VLLAIIVLPLTVRSILATSLLEHSRTLKSTESRIQALKKSISLDFSNPESHYQLGKVKYRAKKDYKQARDSFMVAVRLAPYNGRYHWRLGTALARLGDDGLSEKEISFAKQLAPFDGDLHYKMGFNHFYKWLRTGSAESFTDAMAEFRKAAEIEIVYLTSSLELVAKYLPQYENLKNVVPATVAHHRSFANYLAGKGRWPEALIEYRTTWRLIMKEDPSYRGDEYLVLALARCYLMTGNVQDAKRGYRKALKMTRERRRVFQAVRHNFTHAKQPHEGLSLLQSFKEAFPGDHFLDLEIAKAHLAAGEYDAAEQLFLDLSDLRPSEEIYLHLFNLAMRGRDFDLAEIHANYAIRLNRGKASYYAMLARAREANKDYKGAAQALKHALSIEPQNKSFKEQLDRVGERLLLQKKQ
jgi:tetratricopeptide (TPR) repeat protein